MVLHATNAANRCGRRRQSYVERVCFLSNESELRRSPRVTDMNLEFIVSQAGDAPRFIHIVQNLAVGVAREQQPKRVYVIRIDNWFGPKWLNFAGKFSVGKGAGLGGGMGIGVHK